MLIIAFRYASVVAAVLFLLKAAGAPGLQAWSWAAILCAPLLIGAVYAILGAAIIAWSER